MTASGISLPLSDDGTPRSDLAELAKASPPGSRKSSWPEGFACKAAHRGACLGIAADLPAVLLLSSRGVRMTWGAQAIVQGVA